MEQKQQNYSGFGNGFVIGLLIGVIATLFVTTKKGREIFRELTDRGLNKVEDLEKKLQKTEEEYEGVDDESEYVEPEPSKPAPQPMRVEKKSEKHEPSQGASSKESRVHRFFRSKKS